MKVYQLMGMLKHTNATEEQIKTWMYMNRIEPYMLIVKNENDPINNANNSLELDDELPKPFLNLILKKYYKPIDYPKWEETIGRFLNEEIKE